MVPHCDRLSGGTHLEKRDHMDWTFIGRIEPFLFVDDRCKRSLLPSICRSMTTVVHVFMFLNPLPQTMPMAPFQLCWGSSIFEISLSGDADVSISNMDSFHLQSHELFSNLMFGLVGFGVDLPSGEFMDS